MKCVFLILSETDKEQWRRVQIFTEGHPTPYSFVSVTMGAYEWPGVICRPVESAPGWGGCYTRTVEYHWGSFTLPNSVGFSGEAHLSR